MGESVSVGLSIGSISALVSIGGGTLTVPYLTKRGFNIKNAIATSAAIGIPISIAGTLGYLINGWQHSELDNFAIGYIYLPALVLISLTSIFTAPIGAKLAHRLPVKKLNKIFALLLCGLSLKMLFSII